MSQRARTGKKMGPNCTPAESQRIVELYETGKNTQQVADEVGRHLCTVLRAIRKAGAMRSPSVLNRKFEVDHGAFDRDDAESRYWLGFMLADGSVQFRPSKGIVSLELAECDSAHVEAFRAFLRSEHPLTHSSRKGRACRLRVSSLRLAESLGRHGIHPNKTDSATVPAGLENDVDFWRGFVDGDGWLICKRMPTGPTEFWDMHVGIVGTRAVCESFAAFALRQIGPPALADAYRVRPKKGKTILSVELNGHNARRLAHTLYANATVYLPRKKAVADLLEHITPWTRKSARAKRR